MGIDDSHTGSVSSASSASLTRLADEYWAFRVREQPLLGLAVGDDRWPSELDRESLGDYARRDRSLQTFLARAHALPSAELGDAERTTLEALVAEIELERRAFTLGLHTEPLLHPFGPHVAIATLPDQVALSTTEDVDAYVRRLEAIPRYFDDVLDRLRFGSASGRRVPAVLIPRLLDACRPQHASANAVDGWAKPLARMTTSLGNGAHSAALDRVSRAVERAVRPAFGKLAEFLEHELPRHDAVSVSTGPCGPALYELLIEMRVGPDQSIDEIHSYGLAEVMRIQAAQRRVQAEVGTPGDLRAFLTERAARAEGRASTAEALLDRARALAKRIDGCIPRFFGRIPRSSYAVELMAPEAASGMPPAFAQPPPADGSLPGVHWVNPLIERTPLGALLPLALHEAWPGHLMHGALLNELDHLPAFRRFGMMKATAYVEGWALYCERLGLDMGLYTTPDDHLGRLDMEMWRAVRLVVDTGMHALGWTRDQALAYMTAHTTLPLSTCESEIDRYIGTPAQALAYKIGERRILSLRQRAEACLKERFDLRGFHDRVLNCGPASLDVLEAHVRKWIQECVTA